MSRLDEIKDKRISELEKKLIDIEHGIENWSWGYDGDCGLESWLARSIDEVMPNRFD